MLVSADLYKNPADSVLIMRPFTSFNCYMNVMLVCFIPPTEAACECSNTSPGLIFQASDRAEQWEPNSPDDMGLAITQAEIWYIMEN